MNGMVSKAVARAKISGASASVRMMMLLTAAFLANECKLCWHFSLMFYSSMFERLS